MIRIALFLSLLLIPSYALASTTGSVGSPGVSEGKTQLEMRLGYSEAEESSSQDERFRSRFQIDHGFTNWYAGRLIVQQDKRKGDSYEHDSLTFENRFQFLDKKDSGWDFGVRAGYQHKDGDKTPSALTFGVYELIPLNDYELRFNQLFSRDVGEEAGDGVDAELRFQATRAYAEVHRFGIEGFHDFGNLQDQNGYSAQSHQIGPVFKGAVPFGGLKYETGYRAGISDGAPDHNFKLFLQKSF